MVYLQEVFSKLKEESEKIQGPSDDSEIGMSNFRDEDHNELGRNKGEPDYDIHTLSGNKSRNRMNLRNKKSK